MEILLATIANTQRGIEAFLSLTSIQYVPTNSITNGKADPQNCVPHDQSQRLWCTNFICSLGLGFGDGFRVMVEFGTSSAFRGWVRVRVLGYSFGVRGRKVKSRDCALASDLVRAGYG